MGSFLLQYGQNMIGVVVSLAAALAWAGSSTILKYLSSKVDAISLNAIRLWVGSIILLSFVFLSGRAGELFQTDSLAIVTVAVSGIVAVAIGDTVYIKSLSFLDVSHAYPIAQSVFPVLVLLTAILFLDESFAWVNIMGGALVLLGIYLITRTGKSRTADRFTGRGVALALIAAALWAGGSIALKFGITEMDSFVAAAIRIPAAAVILTGLVLSQRRWYRLQFPKYSTRTALLLVSTGILTYGVAAVCYVLAIQLLGVGKTVLLTAVSPLFLLPLSVFILKEHLKLPALVGVLVSVVGMCLVAL